MGEARVETGKVVQFSAVAPSHIWTEVQPLMKANHLEVGALAESDFEPDFRRLLLMERAGMTRAFTLHIGGQIAGYSLFLVLSHWHYPGTKWALQDAMYVVPEHRGIRAIEFMDDQDEWLAKDGADIIVRQVPIKLKVDFSRSLVRLGYTPLEKSFLRDIRKERKEA
jgi:hypothetical protein